MPDLREVLGELRSDDPEKCAAAIERAAVAVERLIHGVVTALESAGPHDRYIFEHVHRFGPTMIEPVKELLRRSSDPDVRVLCSLLLLRLHSQEGVEVLLEELERGGTWSALAARELGDASVSAAVPPIVHRLRTNPLESEDETLALLRALEQLSGSIPADLLPRLQRPGVPDSVRDAANRIVTIRGPSRE